MTVTIFSSCVDGTSKTAFARAAKTSDRRVAQLLSDVMRALVDQQRQVADLELLFRRQVHIGVDKANAGALIMTSDVEEIFCAKRQLTRLLARQD